MLGHLTATDLMDSLEGIPLAPRKAAHLDRCTSCQESLRAIDPYFGILSEPAPPDLAVAQFDSAALRDGVRDQLLARAVRKSSLVARLTGHTLTPATAWGLGVALLVSALVGGFWHYQTDHRSPATVVGSSGTAADVEQAWFVDDSAELEAEALAWSETELFIVLNELEESEEDALLELIALTFEGDDGV